jgi:hypothetical protein
MACSDLWAIHQRKCKNGKKKVSLVAYLCKVYNYHDSRACGYKRSGILFRLDGMDENEMVLVYPVWNRMIYRTPLWIIL